MKLKLEAKRTILKMSYDELQIFISKGHLEEKILLTNQHIKLALSVGDSACFHIVYELDCLNMTCAIGREQLDGLKSLGKSREGFVVIPSENGVGQLVIQVDLRSDRRPRV
tara:strand:- start:471 stop:803 length:333 start_codon:yes stop_codon:yes gene_type:complete